MSTSRCAGRWLLCCIVALPALEVPLRACLQKEIWTEAHLCRWCGRTAAPWSWWWRRWWKTERSSASDTGPTRARRSTTSTRFLPPLQLLSFSWMSKKKKCNTSPAGGFNLSIPQRKKNWSRCFRKQENKNAQNFFITDFLYRLQFHFISLKNTKMKQVQIHCFLIIIFFPSRNYFQPSVQTSKSLLTLKRLKRSHKEKNLTLASYRLDSQSNVSTYWHIMLLLFFSQWK